LALIFALAGCGGGGSSSDGSGGGTGSGGGATAVCGTFTTTCMLDSIAYGGGVYVAVGQGGPAGSVGPGPWIETSTDGINWTPRDPGYSGGATLTTVVYGSQGFLATDGITCIHSTDGSTWKVVKPGVSAQAAISSVGWDGSRYLVYGFNSTGQAGGPVKVSLDGVTFSDYGTITPSGGDPESIVKVGGTYYAAWDNSAAGILASSSDGLAWTVNPFNPSGNSGINDLISAGGIFVGVGVTNFIAESPDGSTWSDVSPTGITSNGFFDQVAYNGTAYVAVGQGLVYSSSNGTTWTSRSLSSVLGADGAFTSAVASAQGGAFVVLAESKGAMSTDGVHWSVSHL
jgi:hypothetical protein